MVPEEEQIVKYQGTSTLNVPTLLLLVITICSAYYFTVMDKSNKLNLVKSSINNFKNTTDQVNRTIPNSKSDDNKNQKVKNKENIKTSTSTSSTKTKKVKKRDEITNLYDKKIISHIYDGEHLLHKEQYADCIKLFEKLLQKYSLSPRMVYGHARCLHRLAEQMRSNAFLMKAIESYGEVAKKPDVPKKLIKLSGLEQAKQYIFLGHTRKSIVTLNNLVKLLPGDVDVLNELGISYLILGSNKLAIHPFQEVSVSSKINQQVLSF